MNAANNNKRPDIETIIRKIKEHSLSQYHISYLALFGSYVQGTATEKNDIDVLIDFDSPIGLEIVDLKDELETLLEIPVDLVPRKARMRNKKLFNIIKDQLIHVTP